MAPNAPRPTAGTVDGGPFTTADVLEEEHVALDGALPEPTQDLSTVIATTRRAIEFTDADLTKTAEAHGPDASIEAQHGRLRRLMQLFRGRSGARTGWLAVRVAETHDTHKAASAAREAAPRDPILATLNAWIVRAELTDEVITSDAFRAALPAGEAKKRALGLIERVVGTQADPLLNVDRQLANRAILQAAFPQWVLPPGEARELDDGALRRQRDALEDARLRRVAACALDVNRAALCLSGGGIRSATFSLGVLQALACHGVLGRFSYLSTVSGGGYVGGWLSAWCARAGFDTVMDALAKPTRSPLAPDETPIRHLREYSNFLAPRIGFLSADTWTLVATFLRNLLLTWLVLVPLLAAALLVPRIGFAFLETPTSAWATAITPRVATNLSVMVLGIGAVLAMLGVGFVHRPRAELRDAAQAEREREHRDQRAFLKRCFAPLLLSVMLLAAVWWMWKTGRVSAPALLHVQRAVGLQWSFVAAEARDFAVFGGATHLIGWVAMQVAGRRGGAQQTMGPNTPATHRLLEIARRVAAVALVGVTGVVAGLFAYLASLLVARVALGASAAATIVPLAAWYVCFSVPLFVAAVLLGSQLWVGLSSRWGKEPGREWAARFNAWLLILIVMWLALATLALAGPPAIETWGPNGIRALLGTGGVSGLVTILLGRSPTTNGSRDGGSGGIAATLRKTALGLAAPLFAVVLVVLVAWLDVRLERGVCADRSPIARQPWACVRRAEARAAPSRVPEATVLATLQITPSRGSSVTTRVTMRAGESRDARTGVAGADTTPAPSAAAASTPRAISWTMDLALLVLLVALSVGAGALVDTNQFSLHGMYRSRLIRAYLGASRPDGSRTPDPFTGFDERDNLPMQCLWPGVDATLGGCDESLWSTPRRPMLHVVNTALNLVRGRGLATQQRKAESFVITPLHAGSLGIGDAGAYRRTRYSARWGTDEKRFAYFAGTHGPTLGTAMAISGAAASPNMGYHSSAAVTFLMTLFNARLGWWLGNPGMAGERTFHRPSPSVTLAPILSELFGATDDEHTNVYLSDGGHFENLGLYEMVLRRCRYIVVVDASADPRCALEDLGNAIRKIRIDLGVPIEFEPDGFKIFNRDDPGVRDAGGALVGRSYAKGVIRYSLMASPDGAPCRNESDPHVDGTIVYIKPAFYGQEPKDVFNYGLANPAFPHESTADQFFSESQFEAYRSLGYYSANAACNDAVLGIKRALATCGRVD